MEYCVLQVGHLIPSVANRSEVNIQAKTLRSSIFAIPIGVPGNVPLHEIGSHRLRLASRTKRGSMEVSFCEIDEKSLGSVME